MECKPSYSDSLRADIIPDYTDSLSHHGILGMKWGVRRYQNPDGSLTPEGRKRYSDSIRETGTKIKNAVTSDKAKKALAIGAAAAGTALVAYGGYKLASNADLTKNPNFDKSTGFMKQSKPHDHMDDYNKTNPLQILPVANFIHNCPCASMAYEMRRRGFDVRAGGRAVGMSPAQIDRMYKQAEVHDIPSTIKPTNKTLFNLNIPQIPKQGSPEFKQAQKERVDAIFDQCAKFGPNARGNVEIMWTQGGGHIFAFENDSKGRVNLMDAQIAQTGKQARFIANLADKLGGKGTAKKAAEESGLPELETYTHGGYNSGYATRLRTSIDPNEHCRVRRTDNAEIDFKYLQKHNVVKNPSIVKRSFGIGV